MPHLKSQEAGRLEEMLGNIEDQIKRQRDLRSTIENANDLAKEAETTITEFSAKRDLWRHIVVEERALERIREIGEAGALTGYHGPLRSLIKVDLPNQRAVYSAAEGWINAVVVDDVTTALDCVDRLKKTKLGMTKFIPLDQLGKPEPLPDMLEDGVIGPLTQLIQMRRSLQPRCPPHLGRHIPRQGRLRSAQSRCSRPQGSHNHRRRLRARRGHKGRLLSESLQTTPSSSQPRSR